MGIFGKNDKQPTQQTGTTVIDSGTTFKGMIDTKGSIYIDGRFEGILVASNDVTVGKNGEVLGEIRSNILTVNGTIDGLFEVDQVNILGSGKVIGKMQYNELTIEQNGVFEGEGKKKNSTLTSKYNKLEINRHQYIDTVDTVDTPISDDN